MPGYRRGTSALVPSRSNVTAGSFSIEDVYPSVDGGRFAVKRRAGDRIDVWADVFRSGHDITAADLIWRNAGASTWQRSQMTLHENDRWSGHFVIAASGRYDYAIEAWTDTFASWQHGIVLKLKAGQTVDVDALEGAELIARAIAANKRASPLLRAALESFRGDRNVEHLLSDELTALMRSTQERPDLTRSGVFPLIIDRERAEFSNRKGRNNSLVAEPGDPGSFYAVGSKDGGHTAVHPELGTLDDFRALVDACSTHGIDVALDIAVQCSPNHPWIIEHPEWFKKRPDGSMRYAENPPKKYEDIVNPDFGCDDAEALWKALKDVILFWIEQGVTIFRIDNPHTKPFNFWEWLIREVQTSKPGVIFLSEAFTRPKLMKGLAKLGFTQSYTYFTWRTAKWEIEAYLNELTAYPERDYCRPNFFVSTPDILPYHLQSGEAWIFKSRVALRQLRNL
jgi:starch synthase (maltosyl-transferring)